MLRQIPACFKNRGFHSVGGVDAILSDVVPNIFEVLERGSAVQNTRLHSSGNLPASPSLSQDSDSIFFIEQFATFSLSDAFCDMCGDRIPILKKPLRV